MGDSLKKLYSTLLLSCLFLFSDLAQAGYVSMGSGVTANACGAGQFATSIASNGTLTCSAAGVGDVVGPASVGSDSQLAVFDGATGKLLKQNTDIMSVALTTGNDLKGIRLGTYYSAVGVQAGSFNVPGNAVLEFVQMSGVGGTATADKSWGFYTSNDSGDDGKMYFHYNRSITNAPFLDTKNDLINSPTFIFRTAWTPSAANDACTAGRVGFDSGYVYYCVASGNIIRAALATWP